ncbi:putative leader peptide [Streptomyces oceani]|uniref:putative leader peptide n=1 Tax=Streptomyces oceani TaxID=1075402 RepID=UPI0009A0CCAC
MVVPDVSASEKHPGVRPASPRSASGFLGAFGRGAERLHVDLCRIAGATCPRGAVPADRV